MDRKLEQFYIALGFHDVVAKRRTQKLTGGIPSGAIRFRKATSPSIDGLPT